MQADIAVVQALDEMVPNRCGQARPGLDLRHSLTENETAHLVAQLLRFFWIRCRTKALCQSKEGSFFFLLRFEALLYQLDEHSVVAETSLFRDPFDLLRHPGREGNAPADLFR